MGGGGIYHSPAFALFLVGGIDFAVPEGLDMIIQFVSPGVAVQCLPVIIIDDILIEGSETFQYVIGEVFYQLVDQPPVMILVEPDTTTITIVDNDFEEGGPGNQLLNSVVCTGKCVSKTTAIHKNNSSLVSRHFTERTFPPD